MTIALKSSRFVNLLLAALLVGNEFGTWSAIHRSVLDSPIFWRKPAAKQRKGGLRQPIEYIL